MCIKMFLYNFSDANSDKDAALFAHEESTRQINTLFPPNLAINYPIYKLQIEHSQCIQVDNFLHLIFYINFKLLINITVNYL